jgi:hypothetical protein
LWRALLYSQLCPWVSQLVSLWSWVFLENNHERYPESRNCNWRYHCIYNQIWKFLSSENLHCHGGCWVFLEGQRLGSFVIWTPISR